MNGHQLQRVVLGYAAGVAIGQSVVTLALYALPEPEPEPLCPADLAAPIGVLDQRDVDAFVFSYQNPDGVTTQDAPPFIILRNGDTVYPIGPTPLPAGLKLVAPDGQGFLVVGDP